MLPRELAASSAIGVEPGRHPDSHPSVVAAASAAILCFPQMETAERIGLVQGLALPRRAFDTSPMAVPVTRYARGGGVNIAYQVVGEGPLDLVWIPSMTHHVELAWESPAHARHLRRLASTARLIVFDKRGTGMSDRPSGRETLEVRMDDIRAVLDVASSERAVVFGLGDGGPLCILFAATYPERTSGLVLMHSTPRFVRSPELPWLPTRAEMEQRADEFARRWGEQDFHDEMLQRNNPSLSDEERLAFTRVFRLSVSPGAAAAYLRMNLDVDVRDVLPLVRVPTLLFHRKEIEQLFYLSSHYLADRIPEARLVELPGRDFGPLVGDEHRLFSELERFLTEVNEGTPREAEPDRVLATVLFTDIIGATARAAELGDRAWRELLQKHHETVRTPARPLSRQGGRYGGGRLLRHLRRARAGEPLRLPWSR